jgi:hypothetical protein
MQMTDEIVRTHDCDDAENEKFLTGEGVKISDFWEKEPRARDEIEQEIRDELGEYVVGNTSLDIKQHNSIDYEVKKDGYVHTAERFDCDELEDEKYIGVYTNHKKAWVMLEHYNRFKWELHDEVRVECDDEQTLADAVRELLQ